MNTFVLSNWRSVTRSSVNRHKISASSVPTDEMYFTHTHTHTHTHKHTHTNTHTHTYIYVAWHYISRTHRGKIATFLIAEYHRDSLQVPPLGSYSPMPAPNPPFKTILELVLWNGLQSCRCITPDVINVIKMPSFQYFLHLREYKKSLGPRSGE